MPDGRRTQAERRATTRAALLDAAVMCLIEDGYSGLTTRRVADRAGVSQGTQMHYFPTRAQFLAEAMRHVAYKLMDRLRERDGQPARSERRRFEQLLDNLWYAHTTPVFAATMELWVTARTDPEVRAAMEEVQREVNRMIAKGARELLPRLMARPRGRELLDMGLATMRGLAVLGFTGDGAEVTRRWRRARAHLLERYDAISREG